MFDGITTMVSSINHSAYHVTHVKACTQKLHRQV